MPTGRRLPRAALVLTAVGALVATVGAAVLAVRVVPVIGDAFSAPERALPVDTTLDLTDSAYAVYELTGSRSGAGGVSVSTNTAPTVAPDDVQVTAPDGSTLPARTPGIVQTLQRGTAVYTVVARFDVPADGRYRVVVTGDPARKVVVARTPFAAVARSWRWVVTGGAGALALAVGPLWLLVHAVRRSRRPAGPPGPPPPGWYPDPERPGAHRWWDGTRWAPPAG